MVRKLGPMIVWQRKPKRFFCPSCGWIYDDRVTGDQVHEISRGGCGQFCFTEEDVREYRVTSGKAVERRG